MLTLRPYQERCLSDLAKLVSYNPETGAFTWLPRPASMFTQRCSWRTWNTRFAFKPAGRIDSGGYVSIAFAGRKVKAHRLAFYMVHGHCPALIDHINGNTSDNRIVNLRPADCSQNNMNRAIGARNSSGAKGVSWHKKARKWQAHVRCRGTVHYLGLFADINAAHAARAAKAAELHGQFNCNGVRHAA